MMLSPPAPAPWTASRKAAPLLAAGLIALFLFTAVPLGALGLRELRSSELQALMYDGFNAVTRNRRQPAVAGEVFESNAGEDITIMITSKESEIAKQLDVEADLAASYFGVLSTSDKVKYVKSLKLTSTSLVILAHARQRIGRQVTRGPITMREGVKAPTTEDEADVFFQKYGDSFVSEVTTGGEYFGTFVIYTESAEKVQHLKTTLRGKGIYDGLRAGVNSQNEFNNFLKELKEEHFFKDNMIGHTSEARDASNFIEFAQKFTGVTLTSPQTIDFQTQGYEEALPGLFGKGTRFAPIVANRKYFTGTEVIGSSSLAQQYLKLQDIKSSITHIEEIRKHYGVTVQDKALTEQGADVDAAEQSIQDQWSDYLEDPTENFTLPANIKDALKPGVPELKYQYVVTGCSGSNYGTAFNLVPGGDPVDENGMRIKTLYFEEVRGKDGYDLGRIGILWENLYGHQVYLASAPDFKTNGKFTVDLQPGERIKKISVTTGRPGSKAHRKDRRVMFFSIEGALGAKKGATKSIGKSRCCQRLSTSYSFNDNEALVGFVG